MIQKLSIQLSTKRHFIRKHQMSTDAGFSLLEMTVALFLMGLLLTLVAQSGVSMFERWNLKLTERGIRNQISALPLQAHASRQSFSLDDALSGPVTVPTGWSVNTESPILYSDTGICSGGTLLIKAPNDREWVYRLSPPDCRVK